MNITCPNTCQIFAEIVKRRNAEKVDKIMNGIKLHKEYIQFGKQNHAEQIDELLKIDVNEADLNKKLMDINGSFKIRMLIDQTLYSCNGQRFGL